MHVHIIGVCGKTSSALALMFQKMGWSVTGSDQGAYPPASTLLEQNNITVLTPYNEENLSKTTDLVVVAGNALIINPDNPEYRKAQQLGLKIRSYPQVLEEFVVKPESIVVVGNYGKGTISGAIVHALKQLGQNPSYMVGAQMIDYAESLVATNSQWSVLEGDEYPTPPIDEGVEQSKFFYYHPKYLILTSAEWDHYDKFPTEQSYIENYSDIVRQLPSDGLLVVNKNGKNIEKITPHASCTVIEYDDATNLNSKHLFGVFNNENLSAAYALLTALDFETNDVRAALASYAGIEYRMQKIFENENLVIIRDLAHSPVKAEAALDAVREQWPDHHIIGIFEAFSSSLKTKDILSELTGKFDSADEVLIPKVDQIARIEKENRATGKEIAQAIGTNAQYIPKDDLLLEHLKQIPRPAVVIFMSSGGIRGIPQKYLEHITNG